ncbi:MAG TPA: MEDS domain-containing protein, partial [Polyangia bacterium]|nr:MEDS domain-containing protein [Polyangia bacterium]
MTPGSATSASSSDDETPHIVQFYESEDLLETAVVDFLADGLATDAPTVVIATETHRRSFIAQLTMRGFDPGRRIAAGRLIMIDAQEALDQFMVGAAPDWQRFTRTVSPVIERARALGGGREIRAYGQMVDLLWRGGNRSAAVALEEMWNE